MKNQKSRTAERLPCYRGEMLLLKYLELRATMPPSLSTVASEFVEFVAPVDGLVPRPNGRVFRYIKDLEEQRLAEVVRSGDEKATVEITEVGRQYAGRIGLDPVLRSQWEKQACRIASREALM